MKTITALVLTLVLTASLLVGCGCTNRNIENTSAPTVLPTNEEIWNTTEATTRPTTAMTSEPTAPTTTETNGTTSQETDNSGDTAPTDDTIGSRARRMMPQGK